MNPSLLGNLSRRERQVMELLIARGTASASDIRTALPDELSDSAVRTFLRSLVDKGYAVHKKSGKQFIYRPSSAPKEAKNSTIRDVVARLFAGSVSQAVAALIDTEDGTLSQKELEEIEALIAQARARQESEN